MKREEAIEIIKLCNEIDTLLSDENKANEIKNKIKSIKMLCGIPFPIHKKIREIPWKYDGQRFTGYHKHIGILTNGYWAIKDEVVPNEQLKGAIKPYQSLTKGRVLSEFPRKEELEEMGPPELYDTAHERYVWKLGKAYYAIKNKWMDWFVSLGLKMFYQTFQAENGIGMKSGILKGEEIVGVIYLNSTSKPKDFLHIM